MTGIRFTLLMALAAISLRTGLSVAHVQVNPMTPMPVHLLFIVVIGFFSGHFLLNRDPSRQFGELLRAGFQAGLLYAMLIGLFTWFFYSMMEPGAFDSYNARLVQGFVQQGHSEAESWERVDKLYNATSYAAVTFFGCFLAGTISALAFAVLHDKVLRRLR